MTLNSQIFKDYADLKASEKEIAAQIKELQPALMAEIEKTSEKKVEAPFGLFSITGRKTWKFSPAVKVAQEEVDKLMEKEMAEGVATFTESKSVRFEVPKNKDAKE